MYFCFALRCLGDIRKKNCLKMQLNIGIGSPIPVHSIHHFPSILTFFATFFACLPGRFWDKRLNGHKVLHGQGWPLVYQIIQLLFLANECARVDNAPYVTTYLRFRPSLLSSTSRQASKGTNCQCPGAQDIYSEAGETLSGTSESIPVP